MIALTYLALWLAVGAGIGLLAGRLVRTGMVDQSACTQDCRQGRGCTCAGGADQVDRTTPENDVLSSGDVLR